MKFLWIGKYASEKIFQEMSLKGYNDPAAQVSQSNIIHAFDQLGINLDTLNAYNVPSDYRDKYVKKQVWSRNGYSEDVSIGYRNIKYVAHVIRTQKLKMAARKWSMAHKNESEIVVFVYGMQSSLLTAAIEVKKNILGSKIFLIVPDLPEYMDMSMSTIKKVLKKFDWLKITKQMKFVDRYILYTEYMANYLNIPDSKWMLMEGSLNLKDYSDVPRRNVDENRISIMYSGNIDASYGIPELLEAIELINDESYEFWFTGTGNCVHAVIDKSKKDGRIKYLGFLSSREELLLKQRQATMLINMRLPTEKGSEYCFPSKIFEYMASGRPVLTFKIGGIPHEYYNNLVEIKSVSAKDIVTAIQFVANWSIDKRRQFGMKAEIFVKKNKNAMAQAERILTFVKLNNEDKV